MAKTWKPLGTSCWFCEGIWKKRKFRFIFYYSLVLSSYLCSFRPSGLWVKSSKDRALSEYQNPSNIEYHYLHSEYTQSYIYSSNIRTQMNLVPFCFWADWAIRKVLQIFAIILLLRVVFWLKKILYEVKLAKTFKINCRFQSICSVFNVYSTWDI